MSFINPSSLNFHPPSPAPSSSYTHDDDDHDEQPSRKRQRTSKDTASESAAGSDASQQPLSLSDQRKEARAHRNRIAAQNSRDRRKAQFGFLEARVAELEAENRALRAGLVPVVAHQAAPVPAPPPPAQEPLTAYASLAVALEDRLRAEREHARERENQELRERIRTLEQGWEAVVKALTAQGLPAVLSLPASTPSSAPAPVQTSAAFFPSPAPPVVITINNFNNNQGSIAGRHRFRANTQRTRRSRDHSPSSTDGDHRGAFIGSLGVPAAGGSQDVFSVNRVPGSIVGRLNTSDAANTTTHGTASVPTSAPAQKPEALLAQLQQLAAATTSGAGGVSPTAGGDAAMEALFREILASPRAGQAVVPTTVAAAPVAVSSEEHAEKETSEEETKTDIETTKTETAQEQHEREVGEWATEIEVQRLLEFGSGAYGDLATMGFDMDMNLPVDLGMDMPLDLGMAMDMDMSGFDFDLSGVSVSPEMDLLGMYTAAATATAT
ncbi:hypothetical protein D9619_011667 [Psilocybe cf. subviscida]|uniref:X-box-binding protein 1 n=1 Tax=Psilocybe cf. subviscida TaxID=2480587 RepID=A0A8H5BUK7_9AGAR|nr:hypothetical protein D9619_011667 [Psilocybe cf. subviscida]